jgi:hypothetical protein
MKLKQHSICRETDGRIPKRWPPGHGIRSEIGERRERGSLVGKVSNFRDDPRTKWLTWEGPPEAGVDEALDSRAEYHLPLKRNMEWVQQPHCSNYASFDQQRTLRESVMNQTRVSTCYSTCGPSRLFQILLGMQAIATAVATTIVVSVSQHPR